MVAGVAGALSLAPSGTRLLVLLEAAGGLSEPCDGCLGCSPRSCRLSRQGLHREVALTLEEVRTSQAMPVSQLDTFVGEVLLLHSRLYRGVHNGCGLART